VPAFPEDIAMLYFVLGHNARMNSDVQNDDSGEPLAEVIHRETETFDDGTATVRCYDAAFRVVRMETLDSEGAIKVAIDYLYNEAGHNFERVVRDAAGNELRRLSFDSAGEEIPDPEAGPVRWKLMDGADEGLDEKGEEQVGEVSLPDDVIDDGAEERP